MLEETIDPTGYCVNQCHPPTEAHKMKPNHYAKFVWATGGHSVAAAHGNFYRESYTANLGRDLQPILSAVGLDFQVRNYAMGGEQNRQTQQYIDLVWDFSLLLFHVNLLCRNGFGRGRDQLRAAAVNK